MPVTGRDSTPARPDSTYSVAEEVDAGQHLPPRARAGARAGRARRMRRSDAVRRASASANAAGVPFRVQARSRPGSPMTASDQSMTPLTRPSATSRCIGPRSPCTRHDRRRARRRRRAAPHPPRAGPAAAAAAPGRACRPASRAGSRARSRRRARRCRRTRSGGVSCRARRKRADRRPSAAVSAAGSQGSPRHERVPDPNGRLGPRGRPARGRRAGARRAMRGSSRVSASRCGAISGRCGTRSTQRPSTIVVWLSQPCSGSTRSASRRADPRTEQRGGVGHHRDGRGRRGSRRAPPASSTRPTPPPRAGAGPARPRRSRRGTRGTSCASSRVVAPRRAAPAAR